LAQVVQGSRSCNSSPQLRKMALTLQPFALDVNVKDIVSKIEESDAGPVINLGISVKLSISELLQALQQYQQKSHDPAMVPAPQVNGATLLLAPAPNIPSPMAPPAFSPSADTWEQPNTAAAMHFAENITWDTEISQLQPGHGDYASKWAEQKADEGSVLPTLQPGQWEPLSSSRKWTLSDEAPLLRNLRVTRLKAVPLVQKAPTPKTTNLIDLKAMANEKFQEAATLLSAYLSVKAIAKADNTPAWLRSPPGGPPPAPPGAASPSKGNDALPSKQASGVPAASSKAEGTEAAKSAGVARTPLSAPPPMTAASLAARPSGPPPGLPPPKPPPGPAAPKVGAPPGLRAPKPTATPGNSMVFVPGWHAVGKAAPPLVGKAAPPDVAEPDAERAPVTEEKTEDGKTCKQQ